MRYAKGVLITLISKAFVICIGILSSIITARYLGPSGRGVLAVLIVILGAAIQFGSFGFNASMAYFISRDKTLTSQVASNSLLVAVTVGATIALFLFLVGQFSPVVIIGEVDVVYLNIFLIAIPFSFLTQFFQNIFIAHQRIYDFNLLDLVSRLIQFIGFGVVLVLLGLSTYEAVLWFTVVTVISGLMYVFRSSQFTEIKLRFDAPLFTGMFRYGVRTYIASFLMFLLIRSNIMLINYFLGASESGIYSIAMQFADVIHLLPATLGLILFPKVSENVRDPGELTAKVFRFSVLIMGAICIGILLVGRPLIEILFGEKFIGAVVPLYWLTPGIFALSLVVILNHDLAARGVPPIVMIAPGIGLVASVAINLMFLKQYGIMASAVASTTGYFIVLILLFIYFVRLLNIDLKRMFFFTISDFKAIKLKEES